MIRLATAGGIAALLAMTFIVGNAKAQQPNIPGIISGAVEGNPGGAAGAAMGYDYWGDSGYYPGARGNPFGNNPNNNPAFNNPAFNNPNNWRYDNPAYRDYGYRDFDNRSRSRTTYRPVQRNPSVDDEPYRAVIVNQDDNRATLRFSVNGRDYALQPGKQMEFAGRTQRVIRFDRGKGDAVARYQLGDGRYTFSPSEKGWELYRTAHVEQDTPQVTTGSDDPVPSNESPAEQDITPRDDAAPSNQRPAQPQPSGVEPNPAPTTQQ
ncbi:MAG: hypothetical protein DWQ37_00910 [Planctomycetota bacterium]|nr:MAG: hypothetical protein DWQ37_00910 [Planctomycetota bacterium]